MLFLFVLQFHGQRKVYVKCKKSAHALIFDAESYCD